MRSQSVDEDAVEAQDMAAAVMNAAKKTLITQVMKKNVIENIVPTIIGLKHMVSIFYRVYGKLSHGGYNRLY